MISFKNFKAVVKKVLIISFLNFFIVIVIFFCTYCYFEHLHGMMMKRLRIENRFKWLDVFCLCAKNDNDNIEDVDKNIITSDYLPASDYLPIFSKVKSFQKGEYEYFIYKSEEKSGYIFFIILKVYHAKINSHAVVIIDNIDKKIILPTVVGLDKDIVDVSLPLLDDLKNATN